MSAFLSATRGFLNDIGEAEGFNTKAKQKRETDANLLEHAILGIQARTDLSPDEKTFQIGEARKQLQGLYEPHEGPELFKRLKRLFAGNGVQGPPTAQTGTPQISVTAPGAVVGGVNPENPDPGMLVSGAEAKRRLGMPATVGPAVQPGGVRSDTGKPSTGMVVTPETTPAVPAEVSAPAVQLPGQTVTVPKTNTNITLRRGMTINDVLAAGSAPQAKPKPVGSPMLMANGTWAQMTQMPDGSFQPQPIPGYTPMSAVGQYLTGLKEMRDQNLISDDELSSAVKVHLGLEAKAGKEKQTVVERKDGVTVMKDEDGNQYTSVKQIPKTRPDLIEKFTTADKEFSSAETNKEVQLERRAQIAAQGSFDYALQRGVVQDANKALDEMRKSRDKIRTQVREDQLRYNMMVQLQKDIREHPDSENVGSFDVAMIAFHLGMTTGAVKNMRQGKDTIRMHEAARSLPEDMRVAFESWVSGATLSEEQRKNFVNLAKQKMELTQNQLTDANGDYDRAEGDRNSMIEGSTKGRVKAPKKPTVDVDKELDAIFPPKK